MRDDLARQGKPDGIELGAHRGLHVLACASIGGKERFHLLTQLRIIAASLVEQASAVFRIALRGAMEQLLDLRPAFRSQVVPTCFAFRGEALLPPSSSRAAR